MNNSKNFPTSLLKGFADFVHNIYNQYKDHLIIFTLEGEGDKRREILFDNYKQNREEPPIELIKQLPIAIEWINKMGFNNISIPGFEADDCIASIVRDAMDKNIKFMIITNDKDLYQLINPNVSIFDYYKKKIINSHECFLKFGIYPQDFIMFQSIVGDSSDNIPGIKGIGSKGAIKIIEYFKSLEELYGLDHKITLDNLISSHKDISNFKSKLDFSIKEKHINYLNKLFGSRITNLIINSKENAFLSRELVTLQNDLINIDDLNLDFRIDKNPLFSIKDELEKYELKNIIYQLENKHKTSKTNISVRDQNTENQNIEFNAILIDTEDKLNKVMNLMKDSKIVTFDTETTGIDVKNDHIVGFSVCFELNNSYYIPIRHQNGNQIPIEKAKEFINEMFNRVLIGHNLKFDLAMIQNNFDIRPKNKIIDTMILAWLSNPSKDSGIGLDELCKNLFNYKKISYKDISKGLLDFSYLDTKSACQYAAEDAFFTFQLFNHFKKNEYLKKLNLEMEFNFIYVLIYMENLGIEINLDHFIKLESVFQKKIQEIESKIFALVNKKFNVNSPKEISDLILNHLNLKLKYKIKTGFSTNEVALLELIDSHPVIKFLLEHREISKLLSTYVNPFLKLTHKSNNLFENIKNKSRIYTSFIQTGTSTGRLSSKSPNLQNIPIRSEEGKIIREGFVSKDGFLFASLDYSQIELRLLAHFSNDNNLIEAFKNGEDIHLKTAIKIFGEKALGDQKQELRGVAKSINFGLIYGMGSRKLARELKITISEAKQYIESYFHNFPTVRDFLENQKKEIKECGYASTLLKRRRFFDFKNSSSFFQSNFLREGINTIFQGSAADLIKLSMIEIYNCIQNKMIEANMLLQVHDELIFEIKEDMALKQCESIKNIMQNIYPIKVPLVCNVNIGKNWASVK